MTDRTQVCSEKKHIVNSVDILGRKTLSGVNYKNKGNMLTGAMKLCFDCCCQGRFPCLKFTQQMIMPQ